MEPNIAGSANPGQSNQVRAFDPLKAKAKARLRFEIEAAGIPQKALAIGLRTSDSILSRYLAWHAADDLPAYKIPSLVRELGPGYMEWLALQCGGTYHHGEGHPAAHVPVPVLVGQLAKQSGAAVQQLISDLEDHVWSLQERQHALLGLRTLQQVIEGLIQEAEGSNE